MLSFDVRTKERLSHKRDVLGAVPYRVCMNIRLQIMYVLSMSVGVGASTTHEMFALLLCASLVKWRETARRWRDSQYVRAKERLTSENKNDHKREINE